MDFIEGLPRSGGKDTILVIVDRLTKYSHFITLSHQFTASAVGDLFFVHIVKLHGFPQSIITDKDSVLLSNENLY